MNQNFKETAGWKLMELEEKLNKKIKEKNLPSKEEKMDEETEQRWKSYLYEL